MESKTKFDHWAIIEVFGHQTYAGKVTEESIGGCSFVRVDIPEINGHAAFTKLFGQGAIYGITVVDEETARIKAAQCEQQPMNEWEIRSTVNKKLEQIAAEAKQIENCSTDDTFGLRC